MTNPLEPLPLAPPLTASAPREMRGLHAGALVLAGVVVSNGANYAFHLIATRTLGPVSYGTVVSLLTLSGLLSLPVAGVQLAIARSIARMSAGRNPDLARGLAGWALIVSTTLSTVAALVLVALTPLIEEWLGITSVSAIAFMAAATIPAIVTPFAWGVAQGLQRFRLLAISMAAGSIARVGLLPLFSQRGAGATGAMAATLLGGLVSVACVVWPLRDQLAVSPHPVFRLRAVARAVAPFVGGLLAITSLSTIDVIVAKASLGSREAGIYGGAALIGRVILYVPAAVATVLLPKISSRVLSNRSTVEIFGSSLAITATFCLLMTAAYAIVPRLILVPLLGHAFAGGSNLLWMFGLAMTGYAILNVLLVYHLGHGTNRFAGVLLAGALAQLAAYGLFHSSASEILWVDIGTAAALVLLHELYLTRYEGTRATATAIRGRGREATA